MGESIFSKTCHRPFFRGRACYPLGVRLVGCILVFLAVGCGKDDPPPPPTTPEATARVAGSGAARPELSILDEPGRWKWAISQTRPEGRTNLNSTLNVSWAGNGHFLLLENEVDVGSYQEHELIVKHFNAQSTTNRYRCSWFQNDGYVRGFHGQWAPAQARMDWQLAYPTPAPGTRFPITEVAPIPKARQLVFQLFEKNKVILDCRIEGQQTGSFITKGPGAPHGPWLTRLGKAGKWKDTHYDVVKGQTNHLTQISQQRWARGGKFLINEGAVNRNGKPEHFLWVKSWDTQDRVYRWAYLNQDGPVDYFTGYWNEEKQLITWQLIYQDFTLELIEYLNEPNKRSWEYKMYGTKIVNGDNEILSQGAGTSVYQGK